MRGVKEMEGKIRFGKCLVAVGDASPEVLTFMEIIGTADEMNMDIAEASFEEVEKLKRSRLFTFSISQWRLRWKK